MAAGPKDGGQATVELALVLPLLAMALLAVVQVGVLVADRLALAHVARVAAREAVVRPATSPVTEAALGASRLHPGRLEVRVEGGGPPGSEVTVVVDYRAVTDVPLVGRLFPDVNLRDELTAAVG